MVQDGTQEFNVDLSALGLADNILFPSAEQGQKFTDIVVDVSNVFGQEGIDSIIEFFQTGGDPTAPFEFFDFLESQGFGAFGIETGFQVFPSNQSGSGVGDTTSTVLDPQAAGGNDVNVDDLSPTSVLGDFFSAANRLGGIGALSPDLLDAAIRAGSALTDLKIGDFDLTRTSGPPVPADATADAVTEAGMNLLQTFQSDSEGEAVASGGPNDGPDVSDSGSGRGNGSGRRLGDIDVANAAVNDYLSNVDFGFEESKFGDRGVLGERNIVRDMRYPIDIFDDSSSLPNLISFEFFAKENPKLNAQSAFQNIQASVKGIGQAAVELGQEIGILSEGTNLFDEGSYGAGGPATAANLTAAQRQAIIGQYAQGRYVTEEEVRQKFVDKVAASLGLDTTFLDQVILNELTQQIPLEQFTEETRRLNLEQVTDIRINSATERSKDRVFMYVPNSLSFADTIDYDEGSQSALRVFYENAAGNSATIKNALKLGVASAVSSKVGEITQSLLGDAGRIDPYSSIKAQLGLATNPYNELAFKGMARKSFQFNFTFAPTSPEEAKMMQNIIQSFRFHSLPELSESTLQYLAPHEVEVKFYRTTLLDDEDAAKKLNIRTGDVKRVPDTFGREQVNESEFDFRESEITSGGILGFGGSTKKIRQRLVENTEIPRIGRCFVNSVAINYSPQAKSSFFVNGVPSEVQMTLSLSQAITMNRQFVLKGF